MHLNMEADRLLISFLQFYYLWDVEKDGGELPCLR